MTEHEYENIIQTMFASVTDTSQAVLDTLSAGCRHRHIYIMPQGLGGGDLLGRLQGLAVDVFAFCDNDLRKAGANVKGIPVRAYSEMASDPKALVLITSGTYYREIADQLSGDGIDHINATSFLDILEETALDAKRYIVEHVPEILRIRDLFSDAKSKEILIASLMSRLDRSPYGMKTYREAGELEYIMPEYMLRESRQVIFDCGAFTGDSAQKFRDYFGSRSHVVCFEPDGANYEKLRQNCAQPWFTCVKAGVGARSGTLGFDQTGTAGAHFDPQAAGQCRMYSIDDYCEETGLVPTVIKLDVEGFEMQALLGAKRTIQAHRPMLAVCVYHKVSDHIDVPTYLKEINPDYQLYLRHYSDRYTDTVCFAAVSHAQ